MRRPTLPANEPSVEPPVPRPPPTTSNEALAALVVEQLIGQGLLDAGSSQDVLAKLAQGSANKDDWSGWIKDFSGNSTEEPCHGPA